MLRTVDVEDTFERMSDQRPAGDPDTTSAAKDPGRLDHRQRTDDRPQKSYLQTRAQQADEQAPSGDLSKADASKLIDELPERTGRGQ